MLRNALTFRWLIAACLALAVSFGGIVPPLTSPAEAGVRSAADHSLATCCCGMDRRCCGMACCMAQSPVTPERPLPAVPPSEYQPDLFSAAGTETGAAHSRRHAIARAQLASAATKLLPETSLQSLQVRLDV